MTIESKGQSFTFEGRLVSTEVTMDRDLDLCYDQPFVTKVSPQIRVNLEIVARDMVQSVL